MARHLYTCRPASLASVSLSKGCNGTSTITTAISGCFTSVVNLSAAGPTGVTVTFNPASIVAPGSGNSTMAIAVASTVAAGSYPITVTRTRVRGGTHTA